MGVSWVWEEHGNPPEAALPRKGATKGTSVKRPPAVRIGAGGHNSTLVQRTHRKLQGTRSLRGPRKLEGQKVLVMLTRKGCLKNHRGILVQTQKSRRALVYRDFPCHTPTLYISFHVLVSCLCYLLGNLKKFMSAPNIHFQGSRVRILCLLKCPG